MSRPAVQETHLSRQFVVSSGQSPAALVDLPPITWVVQGPRGGRYLASLERERIVVPDMMRDVYVVIDRSMDTRYIRPGSPLERQLASGELPDPKYLMGSNTRRNGQQTTDE